LVFDNKAAIPVFYFHLCVSSSVQHQRLAGMKDLQVVADAASPAVRLNACVRSHCRCRFISD